MYILDTTLRDGGYVVDFQFSKNDIRNISKI
jgi:isopropylmalate/homocitrate/citramalate synthase